MCEAVFCDALHFCVSLKPFEKSATPTTMTMAICIFLPKNRIYFFGEVINCHIMETIIESVQQQSATTTRNWYSLIPVTIIANCVSNSYRWFIHIHLHTNMNVERIQSMTQLPIQILCIVDDDWKKKQFFTMISEQSWKRSQIYSE